MRHKKKKKYNVGYSQKKSILRVYFKTLLTKKKLLIKKKNFFLLKKTFFKNLKKNQSSFKKKIFFYKIGPRKGDKSEMIFVYVK
ncbi:50S ribosomal protein L17 [Candidatus Vidania fulgoroideae]|nr:50S ribosomal protein L17 [Candidatus Vidania fulgoroideae]